MMLELFEKYFSELWILLLEMAPWLMLGLIFAGLLKVYFPQKHVDKYLGKSNFRSALNGSLLGIPMPLCSCGVIPTGVSFFRNGASKGATNSFLISTPQTGVDSILATYSMLGWPFAVLRPLVAFITGIVGGALTNWFVKEKPKNNNVFSEMKINTGSLRKTDEAYGDDSCGNNEFEKNKRHSLIRAVNYAFIELLQDIAKWLVIGFLVAALISVLLPDDFFSSFRGFGLIEILIVLAASVPIYICATGSIPIAVILLFKGVSPGAALVFLMAGPATNVATMTVLDKTMGRKSLLVYLAAIIGGAILSGLFINWIFPSGFFLKHVAHIHGEGHEMLPFWLQLLSAVILILSIVGGYFIERIKKSGKMENKNTETFLVEGMTCSHCEASVENNLLKVKGVTNVVANNHTGTVQISGASFNITKIEEVVNGLGYRFKGKK